MKLGGEREYNEVRPHYSLSHRPGNSNYAVPVNGVDAAIEHLPGRTGLLNGEGALLGKNSGLFAR